MAFDLNTPLGQELQAQGYDPMGNLPRGLRNGNPGNIVDGLFAQSQPGYTGSDGRFATFNSLSGGYGAMDKLLQSYASKGLSTPLDIVSRWAPAGDGNNQPSAYASSVAKTLGIGPTDKIDMTDPAQRAALARAMAGVENGTGGGGLQEGRSASTGGLTPATDADTSNINSLLASYRHTDSNSGDLPSGTIGDYLMGTPGVGLGPSLTKVGAAFMMRDNPAAAQMMLNSIRASQKSTDVQWKDLGDTGDGKFRLQQDNHGNLRTVPNPNPDTPDAEKPDVPKSAEIKALSENSRVIYGAAQNIDTADRLQQAILDGKFNARWDSRLGAYVDNLSGKSTENSRLIKDANALINQYVINVASQEKGPMTRAKMENARLSVLPSGAENDNATMFSAFSRIKDVQKANHAAASTAALNIIDQHPQLDTKTVGPDGKPGSLKGFIENKGAAWDKSEQDLQSRYPDFIKTHDNPPPKGAAPVKVASPDEARKLPSGTHFITPDGKEYTR